MKYFKFILIFLVFGALKTEIKNPEQVNFNTKKDTLSIDENVLKTIPDIDLMHQYAKQYLGKHADLFIAIKIEESGNNNNYSWLAKKHNNLCGMRFPNVRKTYAIGKTNSNYSIYKNWFDCMLDFKLYILKMEQHYIKKFNKVPNDIDLIEYMSTNFNHFETWKINLLNIIYTVKRKYN